MDIYPIVFKPLRSKKIQLIFIYIAVIITFAIILHGLIFTNVDSKIEFKDLKLIVSIIIVEIIMVFALILTGIRFKNYSPLLIIDKHGISINNSYEHNYLWNDIEDIDLILEKFTIKDLLLRRKAFGKRIILKFKKISIYDDKDSIDDTDSVTYPKISRTYTAIGKDELSEYGSINVSFFLLGITKEELLETLDSYIKKLIKQDMYSSSIYLTVASS